MAPLSTLLINAAAVVAAAVAPSAADDTPAQCLHFEEALVGAIDIDPRMDSARGRSDAAKADALLAYSQYAPQIGLFAQVGLGDTLPLDQIRDDQVGIQGTVDLYTFGRRKHAQAEARALLEAAREGEEEAKVLVLRSVALSFLDVLRANALIELAKQELKIYERDARTVDDRLERQVITIADASQIRAREAVARADLRRAIAQRDAAAVRLEVLSGRKAACVDGISAADYLTYGTAELFLLPEEQAVDFAMGRSFTVKRAEASVDVAKARVRQANRANLPVLSANGFTLYEYDSDTGDFNEESRIGLTLRQELFAGGANRARRLRARSELRQAEADARLERISLEDQVRRALHRAIAAEDIRKALNVASSEANNQLKATERAYELNAVALTDLVIAVETYYGSAAREVNATNEYLTALVELYAALGTISQPL
ncbi:MAG: TolC family protein [Pseudomonadota bacterium]